MKVVECKGLSSGYGGIPTLRALDLHVEEGEVVALFGANGSGKTTTLLTISGVLPCLKGSVEFLGKRVSARRPHVVARQGMAHVPDDRALFSSLTVRENLSLGVRKEAQVAEALLKVFKTFPSLRDLQERRAGLLSGGEQQMLAVGRALAGSPRLLMIDEMSLGLAPKVVSYLLPAVRSVAQDQGTGVLLVEQQIDVALSVCDRAYVLNRGRVILHGTREEVARDRDSLVDAYLGQGTAGTAAEGSPE
jgi:branched-chain amino acid transport system ATP-binding protein